MVFAWAMRLLLFIAVALGFATAAFQTKRRDRNHAMQSMNIKTLLIATWSGVIILAVVTITEMIMEPSVPRVICAIIEVLSWAFVVVHMFRTS
ncbi:hypothetical protein IKF12_02025 [Candidatus Saccharibacteria bacterium]|nr:hypothetical protein [Candidatus Saccharibacteria bacterium]